MSIKKKQGKKRQLEKEDCFLFFILLSGESGGGAIHRTNPDSLIGVVLVYGFSAGVLLLTSLICYLLFPPSGDNYREASYPRMQPRGSGGS